MSNYLQTCPHLEVFSESGNEVIYGRANIEEYLAELNRKVREEVINRYVCINKI